MYELVSVTFPFTDEVSKGKPRPGFVISPPFGKHQQVIVAYVTTQLDEQLETDLLLDPTKPYFLQLGLLHKSLLRLHRLGTFQPVALKQGKDHYPENLLMM